MPSNIRRHLQFIGVLALMFTSWCGSACADEQYRAYVVHGFKLPGDAIPGWTKQLQRNIQANPGLRCDIVDWRDKSYLATPGWSQATGDLLFARLAHDLLEAKTATVLHLISHSRGCVVVSEAQRRLAWYSKSDPKLRDSIATLHITMLDPHPANGRAGFSSKNLLLAGKTRIFESLTRDPEPSIWEGADFAEMMFQRREMKSVFELPVNPWGGDAEAPFAKQLNRVVDLTDKRFAASPGRFRNITHVTIGSWYARTVLEDKPLELADDVVLGDGYHYSPRGGGRTPATPPSQPPTAATEPATIFNGDFGFDGMIDDVVWSTYHRPNGLPGWDSNSSLRVEDGKLICGVNLAESAPHRFVVRHPPVYLPPSATSIAFDISECDISEIGGESKDAVLRLHVIAVAPNSSGLLSAATDPESSQLIGKWKLTEETKGRCQAALPEDAPITAAFRFELTAPHRVVFKLDDIRLEMKTE